MFYTREQVEKLEKYRKYFETAINSGFARNVGSIALKEIEDIYDEAYGSHYTYNSGCSICVLGFLKRVGEPFLKESKLYAAEKRVQEAAEADEEERKANTPEPPKTNKKTRKKKVTEDNGKEEETGGTS